MTTYSYNGYNLDISTIESINVYEGTCRETSNYLIAPDIETLEKKFRGVVDRIVAVLEYKGTKLIISKDVFEEPTERDYLVGEFYKPHQEVPVFYGREVKEIKKQLEDYLDVLEKTVAIYNHLTDKE